MTNIHHLWPSMKTGIIHSINGGEVLLLQVIVLQHIDVETLYLSLGTYLDFLIDKYTSKVKFYSIYKLNFSFI